MHMKKFIVLQQIGKFKPDYKEGFDSLTDAIAYTELMKKAHPDRKYEVYINNHIVTGCNLC